MENKHDIYSPPAYQQSNYGPPQPNMQGPQQYMGPPQQMGGQHYMGPPQHMAPQQYMGPQYAPQPPPVVLMQPQPVFIQRSQTDHAICCLICFFTSGLSIPCWIISCIADA